MAWWKRQKSRADKWKTEEVRVGAEMETTFHLNPRADSPFRYRATHLDGRRAPKVVLCDDPRVHPGHRCRVRIRRIRKPRRTDRGCIEVEYVSGAGLALEGVYLDGRVARKLQVLLENGLNILLDGPHGCGKTVLARALATTLGMEFVFFNCGAVVEASDFLATIQVRASEDGQPVTDFVKTEVLTALEMAQSHPRRRFLVFLDEFNRCQESARNALMPALDATRRIFHPIENRFAGIPDNVQFIAAVNQGSEFSGTFGIDAAQLDRFAPLKLGYMPPEEEEMLLRSRHPDLDGQVIARLVEIADRIRHTPELGCGLSVRATEEACVYLESLVGDGDFEEVLADVLQTSFCGRFAGNWDDITTDAGVAWSVIEEVLRGSEDPVDLPF